jgi:hypothetical protein
MEHRLLVACASCHALHVPADPLAFEPLCPRCAGIHPFCLLDMSGSFPLTHGAIDALLTRTAPGNYALGYADDGEFLVYYVGRADADLRASLHDWVDEPSRCARTAPRARAPRFPQRVALASVRAVAPAGETTAYTRFAFSYASSADAAFTKECRNYEELGGARELDNAAHPATPIRSAFAPPVHQAGIFPILSRCTRRLRQHLSPV